MSLSREALLSLLGDVPTDPWGGPWPIEYECRSCGETFAPADIAWGTHYFDGEREYVNCIECAVKAAMETKRQSERVPA